MKTFCVSTYVYGEYVNYLPLYIYAILKAYPDYYVKVFVHERLDGKAKKTLALVKTHLSARFEIIENFFIARKPQTYHRWMLPYEQFKEFDYAYINDVDLLVMKEEPSLLDFHISHCEKYCLPYSNFLRKPNPERPVRLSGCHFIHVQPYYEKMTGVINEVLTDPLFDITKGNFHYPVWGKPQWSDLALLYKMVKKGIGVNDNEYVETKNRYPHHHGIHLGCFRAGRVTHQYLSKHIGLNILFWNRVNDIVQLIQEPLFQRIYKAAEGNVRITLDKFVKHFKQAWKHQRAAG